MKGNLLRVITAITAMAATMAFAGQDHDRDRDANVRHAHTRVIHHRGGTQYITTYSHGDADDRHHRHHHMRRGDRDFNSDDMRSRDNDDAFFQRFHRHRTGSSRDWDDMRRNRDWDDMRRSRDWDDMRRADRDRDRDFGQDHNRGLHKGWTKGRHNPHHGD